MFISIDVIIYVVIVANNIIFYFIVYVDVHCHRLIVYYFARMKRQTAMHVFYCYLFDSNEIVGLCILLVVHSCGT